jgi:hypothetical protein
MAKKRETGRVAPPITSFPRGKDQPADRVPARIAFNQATWTFFCCAILIAYCPSLNGGFVWDDNGHVTKPALQSMHGLWRIWFDLGATQQYYPLLRTAFWIEHRLWGDAVLGYHLVNIALHALSACLVVVTAGSELPAGRKPGYLISTWLLPPPTD